jgi:hypothetical protein
MVAYELDGSNFFKVEIMNKKKIQRIWPKAYHALVERTHNSIVRIVKPMFKSQSAPSGVCIEFCGGQLADGKSFQPLSI